MPKPENQNCGNCRFYAEESDSYGYCHRYPPTVFFKIGLKCGEYHEMSPKCDSQDWCGEWKETLSENRS